MTVSNAEIVAVAEGAADRQTELRVTAAALLDPLVRERLQVLQSVLSDTEPVVVSESQQVASARQLQAILERATAHLQPSGWAATLARLGATVHRELDAVQRALTLPSLAPSFAASDSDSLALGRDTLMMEGVAISFHELPGAQLRVLVDLADTASPSSNALGLVLSDGTNETVVVVALDERGLGYHDIALPPVHGSVVVTQAALLDLSESTI